MMKLSQIVAVLFLLLVSHADCFRRYTSLRSVGSESRPQQFKDSMRILMKDDSVTGEGYGPFGSLIRQGPVPFFIRIINPQTYDAAVQKYMRLEKCDINTAQSNMDAYFEDPNGWAANKLKGKTIDYENRMVDPSQIFLTSIWAIGIIGLFVRVFTVQVLHL
jgi:hypothetical protein